MSGSTQNKIISEIMQKNFPVVFSTVSTSYRDFNISIDRSSHEDIAYVGNSEGNLLLNMYSKVNLFNDATSSESGKLLSINTSSSGKVLYAVTALSTNLTKSLEIDGIMREILIRVIITTSTLYHDLLEKCSHIISSVDIDDEVSKDIAVSRITDILEPFRSVIQPVFTGIVENCKEDSENVSFLLNQVLLSIDSVDKQAKMAIINNTWIGAEPGVRFAAIQALDNLDLADAKRLMASIYPTEGNKIVRNLIESSLRAS